MYYMFKNELLIMIMLPFVDISNGYKLVYLIVANGYKCLHFMNINFNYSE